jgi:ribosome biogenesis protein NSA1
VAHLLSSEVFVSDQTSNLFAIDTRNGRVIYGYKGNYHTLFSNRTCFFGGVALKSVLQGLAGSITSMAPSPAQLVSTALDRYARVHSTFPPPPEAGQPQDDSGAVLEKVYMKSIPTCVVWDGAANEEDANNDDDNDVRCGDGDGNGDSLDDDEDDEDVWERMQVAGNSEDEGETQAQRRRTGRK